MPSRRFLRTALISVLLLGACSRPEQPAASSGAAPAPKRLSVAISPYQDIAMLVNARPLGLEKKYDVALDLHTMAWEDIVPAIASAGNTVDVGFGSLIEYLTKQRTLNASSDPLVFVYPLYVFKGGAFVTFNPAIGTLDKPALQDPTQLKKLLSYRIGAQKSSVYEMIMYTLARRAGIDPKSLKLVDTPLNDGILATQHGSLDVAEAGLTQMTEANKRGGHVVFTMEDVGLADITGLICKKSTLEKKRPEIEALVRMWFDATKHVMSDLDPNSAVSLDYLRKNSSTAYTVDQYKTALSQEYFPLTVDEARKAFFQTDGAYSVSRISSDVGDYLLTVGKTNAKPTTPVLLTVR